MIFYFSGTGNSHWVAKTVAKSLSDRMVDIADYFNGSIVTTPTFDIASNERIGFVFPVHSWGVPKIVCDFINSLQLNSYTEQLVYGIFTCGDECGLTRQMFLKLLKKKGLTCHHTYSIQMPNSYIVFPGFDVDSKELEKDKKQKAKEFLPNIIDAIREDKPIKAYKKGRFAYIKSHIIYKMFCKYSLDSRPFYSTYTCTACGLCEKICPTKNITIVKKHPVWGDNCTQCLSCIHHCPMRAIEYGNKTQKKGRYYFKE